MGQISVESATRFGVGAQVPATPESKVGWDIMDVWKDYGKIEKKVRPECLQPSEFNRLFHWDCVKDSRI